MNKLLDSLHTKILNHKFAEVVSEAEVWALVEAKERDWIPCENELPKETGYYLVTYKKNENLLVGYWLFNGIDFNQTEEVEVLYWQPLPAPYNPKGE